MEFSRKLDKLLKRRNISQERLGEIIGFSQTMVSRWTKGQNVPDIVQGLKIARALDVSLDDLADPERALLDEDALRLAGEIRRLVDRLGHEEAWKRLVKIGDEANPSGWDGHGRLIEEAYTIRDLDGPSADPSRVRGNKGRKPGA